MFRFAAAVLRCVALRFAGALLPSLLENRFGEPPLPGAEVPRGRLVFAVPTRRLPQLACFRSALASLRCLAVCGGTGAVPLPLPLQLSAFYDIDPAGDLCVFGVATVACAQTLGECVGFALCRYQLGRDRWWITQLEGFPSLPLWP